VYIANVITGQLFVYLLRVTTFENNLERYVTLGIIGQAICNFTSVELFIAVASHDQYISQFRYQ